MGELETILQAITTVGFPIVCTIAMGIYVKSQNQAQREDIREMNRVHAEEMDKFQTALNNNTIALTRLCEKLDGHFDDLK